MLYDFKAAFPSLAHEMIWDVLRISGIDPGFMHVIKQLYTNNQHILKVNGELFRGVVVHSGVRQGCP